MHHAFDCSVNKTDTHQHKAVSVTLLHPWQNPKSHPALLFTTHRVRLSSSIRSSINSSRMCHLFPPLCRLQGRCAHGWVRAGQLGHATCQADEVGLQLEAQLGEGAATGGPQRVEQTCSRCGWYWRTHTM